LIFLAGFCFENAIITRFLEIKLTKGIPLLSGSFIFCRVHAALR
jgi:hypothetical protein